MTDQFNSINSIYCIDIHYTFLVSQIIPENLSFVNLRVFVTWQILSGRKIEIVQIYLKNKKRDSVISRTRLASHNNPHVALCFVLCAIFSPSVFCRRHRCFLHCAHLFLLFILLLLPICLCWFVFCYVFYYKPLYRINLGKFFRFTDRFAEVLLQVVMFMKNETLKVCPHVYQDRSFIFVIIN